MARHKKGKDRKAAPPAKRKPAGGVWGGVPPTHELANRVGLWIPEDAAAQAAWRRTFAPMATARLVGAAVLTAALVVAALTGIVRPRAAYGDPAEWLAWCDQCFFIPRLVFIYFFLFSLPAGAFVLYARLRIHDAKPAAPGAPRAYYAATIAPSEHRLPILLAPLVVAGVFIAHFMGALSLCEMLYQAGVSAPYLDRAFKCGALGALLYG